MIADALPRHGHKPAKAAASPTPATAPPQFFRLPRVSRSRHTTQGNAATWDEVEIRNEAFKVKVGKNAGGAITYLSRANSDVSVVNRMDKGRLVQQSFYGSADGSAWVGQPWVWNPVQGGSQDNSPGVLLQLTNPSPDSVGSVSIPRNWAGNQVLIDTVMETIVTLKSDHIVMKNIFYYSGWKNQTIHNQEMPAIFLCRTFDKLWFYNGSMPWTAQPLQSVYPETWVDVTQAKHTIVAPTEGWLAYQNSRTGEAVGIMSPSTKLADAYRVGFADVGGVDDDATSYVAPLGQFAISAGQRISYDVYLTLGTVESIRLVFARIQNSLRAGSVTTEGLLRMRNSMNS